MEYLAYIKVGLAAIGAFSIVASQTPNKADDKVAQKLLNIVNVLGMNVGNAKNKE